MVSDMVIVTNEENILKYGHGLLLFIFEIFNIKNDWVKLNLVREIN